MPARTFAIGDIHGCDVALEALIHLLNPQPEDTLVVLGDAVDRGPQSRRVIELLDQLRRFCQLKFLMGNHEEMLLNALRHPAAVPPWLRAGGVPTLQSYGGSFNRIPPHHLDFLASARPYWENDQAIFVHANLEPDCPLAEQSAGWLRWEKLTRQEQPHPSGKRVICGHTVQPSGLPLVFPGWVCLDTLAYEGLFLTALELETDCVYQARQTGEIRYGVSLSDLV